MQPAKDIISSETLRDCPGIDFVWGRRHVHASATVRDPDQIR
eukprot:CAMPEP_0205854290 /NCGR_PEP_ID=MMETSP1083-20121108/2003_1 /ASSEMBLY_ACC=CAM_ASM_000430 /TAXON_ID=97485 /ORGANISM="Prymnesium parvum, Strain Texoma1" /LENGTH=41 /DNA_ID= /DNA_START= /DNA_END= /DNA_ORIENTATION=